MVSFLAGILLSLLPERYRRWWEPASTLDFLRASFVSGLVQGLGCFVVFILRYLIFFQQRVMEMGGQVIEAGADEALASRGGSMSSGFSTKKFLANQSRAARSLVSRRSSYKRSNKSTWAGVGFFPLGMGFLLDEVRRSSLARFRQARKTRSQKL